MNLNRNVKVPIAILPLLVVPVFASAATEAECLIASEKLMNGIPSIVGDYYVDAASGWIVALGETQLKTPISNENIALFQRIERYFDSIGSDFVLIIPPRRSLFVPSLVYERARIAFGSDVLQSDHFDAYNALLSQLEQAGLFAPPLYDRMANVNAPYFLTDHHWTPDAAFEVASVLWEMLYESGVIRLPSTKPLYTAVGVSTVEMSGSYARRVKEECGVELPSEVFQHPVYSSVTDLNTNAMENSLFGDPVTAEFEVVLAGTSFSSTHTGMQFDGALGMWLNTPVINLAVSGGGISASFEAVRSDPEFLNSDLFIWEIAPNQIPERSDRVRVAAAAVLSECGSEDTLIDISFQNEDWSDWLTVASGKPIVRLNFSNNVDQTTFVEADYGDEVRRYVVSAEGNRVDSHLQNSIRELFISDVIIGVHETNEPNKVRFMLKDFEGTIDAQYQNCASN